MTTNTSPSLRTLGNSDLQLTSIGLGAWAIGGPDWKYGWGPQDDNDSIAAIHRSLELGINWIDTAAVYGGGHSEEVVARAVKSSSHKPYIFTKCVRVALARRWHASELTRAGFLDRGTSRALCAACKVQTIDLYQVHWPDPDDKVEVAIETLARFREQGKIRWIGVSNFSVEQMKRAIKVAPITSLQPPYSMLRRGVEAEILRFALVNGIGVINYSPMLSGLLTGKMTAERIAALPDGDWRRKSPEFNEPRLGQNLRLVELLREIGDAHGVTPGVVAIAWTLHNPAITGAIVGGRNAHQVEETAAALTFRLSEAEYKKIVLFLASLPDQAPKKISPGNL